MASNANQILQGILAVFKGTPGNLLPPPRGMSNEEVTLYAIYKSLITGAAASSGAGYTEKTEIEGGSDELVFDENKRYTLPSDDYDITIGSTGHDMSGKVVEIVLVLSLTDLNLVTLDLSPDGKELLGVGFTETQPNEYTFNTATNASSTRYHYVTLRAINGFVVSATSETSEQFVAEAFVDIPDEPTNFFYLKKGTNQNDGATMDWTDVVSGITISNGAAGKPVLNAGGWMEFDGVSRGMELLNNTSINTLLGNIPAIAAIHTTIKFPTLGTQVNAINIYDDSLTYRIFRPVVLGSTDVLRCIHRTANTNDTVAQDGTTSLLADTWYVVSVAYNADNTVDVYLDGVLEISGIDLNALSNYQNKFTALALGYKNLNGSATYEECDIVEMVMSSSLSNFANTAAKLVANKPV